MTLKSDAKRAVAEASLPVELRPVFRELREDYVAAIKLHVPGWTGGPNPNILVELIRRGWRKPAGSN